MKRTFVVGGISAGLLASALVTSPAQATDEVPSVILANTNMAARQVAAFWYGERKANLIGATPYNVETKVVAKHVSTGGPAADSKPGTIPAIGDEKSGGSSKNVNLPRTTGKVFFIGADHRPHWCTGTSIQSAHRNLVATAGHCVYDTESNKATLDKWVFIPGYYEGKTPWGIYVGKQAFTHYDYDVYEDGDRDYAFVTVYNGVIPTSADVDRHYDSKRFETKTEAEKEKARLLADPASARAELTVVPVRDYRHVVPGGIVPGEYETVLNIKYETFQRFNPSHQLTVQPKPKPADPKVDGTDYFDTQIRPDAWKPPAGDPNAIQYLSADHRTLYFKISTNVDGPPEYRYYYRTYKATFDLDYKVVGKLYSIGLKDVGRLGDNVGGQGLAYNQKVGKNVFVFGYPSGSHPDGNHAFTGKTLKYQYGKTFAASASAIKAEELIGVKSSFTGEGSIGSAWLVEYKSARRLGFLNGVTIGVADRDGNNRYDTSVSPYFDGETYGVYKVAANLWSGKIV
ncbi:hypothetical protein GCM10009555_047700 [Acrocarpospora macrocephala]|uniref:Peptidase n=1 Tax=Acrocarpospora macrocephala TaxID=150177 RepID=A0A5M3WXR7_9ACTN|nr:hypothetical protein [Acrocarpospora macrocephala]GES12111.1 hypothetical protein Amac_057080 [Acrocarpospora macrocephala]